jgi:hypothetical protein
VASVGQLIKLQDYISRYETDVYHYAPEFIRLKKKQWEQTKERWETARRSNPAPAQEETWEWLLEKPSLLERMKKWVRRSSVSEDDADVPSVDKNDIAMKADNIDELKLLFLEEIFHMQLKWASSTAWSESNVESKFYYDETLKYFLQRFPDTYLCLYKPVFLVKSARVELDILLLSPTATWCITIVEGEKDNIIIASSDRFWTEMTKRGERRRINPVIALQRMEKIVADIYKRYHIDFPVRKAVINRYGYIDDHHSLSGVECIDKRNYARWFAELRQLAIPLKHVQLKAASSLLRHCYSHYDIRTAWNTDEEKV